MISIEIVQTNRQDSLYYKQSDANTSSRMRGEQLLDLNKVLFGLVADVKRLME